MGKQFAGVESLSQNDNRSIHTAIAAVGFGFAHFVRSGGLSIAILCASTMPILFSFSARAQVVTSDGTTATQVNPGTLTQTSPAPAPNGLVVTGGTATGTNLFHSFSSFSPETTPVEFRLYTDPALQGITDIFARVTDLSSSNISNIDGLLQVL